MRSTSAVVLAVLASCGPKARDPAIPPPVRAPVAAEPSAVPTPASVPEPPAAAPPARAALDALRIPPDFHVTLERTMCFGRCPVYTATIDAAGEVFFASQSPDKGCATTTLDPTEVALLAHRVELIGYFDLAPRYLDPITDYPSANTAVTMGGRQHRVHHYLADHLGAPDRAERAALVRFERAIDAAIGAPLEPLGPCAGRSPYPDAP